MLYTRKGDEGTTKTLDTGARISKASALPEALGTLDEVNSYIGYARAVTRRQPTSPLALGKKNYSVEYLLHEIQENLFIVQAELAGADKKITKAKVTRAELVTDTIEKVIPPITGFSIAGGTELSALLDVTRTMARRAERRCIGVHEANLRTLSKQTLAYLNRLSSVLFALARYANYAAGVEEQKPSYQ
jgi:cob(I)alamin adenosyltransferase